MWWFLSPPNPAFRLSSRIAVDYNKLQAVSKCTLYKGHWATQFPWQQCTWATGSRYQHAASSPRATQMIASSNDRLHEIRYSILFLFRLRTFKIYVTCLSNLPRGSAFRIPSKTESHSNNHYVHTRNTTNSETISTIVSTSILFVSTYKRTRTVCSCHHSHR